jgi:hypothetical protein
MSLNFIKIRIESQKSVNSNYIMHNAIRLCKETIKSRELDKLQRKEVKNLLSKFELLEDPWCWSGIPKSKELLSVVELLEELEEIIA